MLFFVPPQIEPKRLDCVIRLRGYSPYVHYHIE